MSTDAQQKEATIESQVAELKREIKSAGHELVKEYIDNGITGTRREVRALEQLRRMPKPAYSTIYFHSADRIAPLCGHVILTLRIAWKVFGSQSFSFEFIIHRPSRGCSFRPCIRLFCKWGRASHLRLRSS